ncbi:transposase [Streptomyces sp. NBC_01571]|uniref:transposase n=1 Tax=Streptomyces sp. NBC_01571 TaxID=2975883 RepID=UPI00224F0788|nr:transposase [Streptomyces sp. NBC_01571]MCX4571688.1 transposase [Streptomyces sp. NBC_01571]
MGRKSSYPEEFRKDAVALYRAAAGKRTYVAMAADLGITAESLRTWVRKDEAQSAPEDCVAGGTRRRSWPGFVDL